MKFIFHKKLHKTDKHLLESRFRLLGVEQKLFFLCRNDFFHRAQNVERIKITENTSRALAKVKSKAVNEEEKLEHIL